MPRYTTEREHAIPVEQVLEALMRPDILLAQNRLVDSVIKLDNNLYEAVLKPRKFGITLTAKFKFTVIRETRRDEHVVVYTTTSDSENTGYMVLRVKPSSTGKTLVQLETVHSWGPLLDFFVRLGGERARREIGRFFDELIGENLKAAVEILARERAGIQKPQPTPAPTPTPTPVSSTARAIVEAKPVAQSTVEISCLDCILYDHPATKYCYYLGATVENPSDPPCKGKGYRSLKT